MGVEVRYAEAKREGWLATGEVAERFGIATATARKLALGEGWETISNRRSGAGFRVVYNPEQVNGFHDTLGSMVSVKAAAHQLGVHPNKVSAWGDMGRFPTMRTHGVMWVDMAGLIAFTTTRDDIVLGTVQGCRIGGCLSPVVAKGLCNVHYKREKATGDPLTPNAQGADMVAEFEHMSVLIGVEPAITRLAEVYGSSVNGVIDNLRKNSDLTVWRDHLGRLHVTPEARSIKVAA